MIEVAWVMPMTADCASRWAPRSGFPTRTGVRPSGERRPSIIGRANGLACPCVPVCWCLGRLVVADLFSPWLAVSLFGSRRGKARFGSRSQIGNDVEWTGWPRRTGNAVPLGRRDAVPSPPGDGEGSGAPTLPARMVRLQHSRPASCTPGPVGSPMIGRTEFDVVTLPHAVVHTT
jgi:hypothetical protein